MVLTLQTVKMTRKRRGLGSSRKFIQIVVKDGDADEDQAQVAPHERP